MYARCIEGALLCLQATYTDAYVPKKPRSSSQQNLMNLAKSNSQQNFAKSSSQQKLSSPDKGANSQPSNLPKSPSPAQQQQKHDGSSKAE